jgi:nucleoside-diphosphate-sugar epimerase
LKKNIYNETFNIGSGEVVSINEIIEKIKAFVPDFQTQYNASNINDVSLVQLDINKLLKHIGTYKFTPISEGLIQTYDWLNFNHK